MSDDLRKTAEARLKAQDVDVVKLSEKDVRKLAHELQVHQIELEMQNEELKRAQTVIEASRRKYSDLYDFAPVGYVTLDEKGLILEANLTFSSQMAMERTELIGKPLTAFIPSSHIPVFFNHLKDVFRYGQKMSAELRLKGKERGEWHALLESVAVEEDDKPPTCRTSLIDISRRIQSERALKAAEAELEQKVVELSASNERLKEEISVVERMNRLMVKREITMEELKRENKKLKLSVEPLEGAISGVESGED